LLTGSKVNGPEALIAKYPQIEKFVQAASFDREKGFKNLL
jgi:hypothetical protein